ncbi:hypothetical protein MHAS_04474 [Mycolicibacterium hassiacum DSM 44199]|jgi:hypothetical protein|uniref:DUF2470 domain-containing protein n=1 Tax=Mycolicibacterium hassiacum TaxID=46351 RepID=UPI00036FC034|nr:DUF2470 domain-containing protein [Mycolicibacterium hassiacum]MBX5489404.1 DUF2470 domain-containing protein [Mycolicibacterium hassiacum]MDA4085388.1 prephenate dehydratase [Mycolicibacterium hassiacum DSM 44199]PZN20179.1 MAG: DUF2470 domain-containing protein [Mycolicibacterium hassiacum]VCT92744.1 hypothetical protein MHAS_04474 [Mycolicibacterium hassiacum DSM 44199]
MTDAQTTPQTAPTTAERIRTTFARCGGATIAVDGLDPVRSPVHHLLDDGSFAVTAPAASALVRLVHRAPAAGLPAMLEMTDQAPVPLREPVRSLVWVRGQLHRVPRVDVPALLDLIAEKNPNPALLQVNSGSRTGEPRAVLLRMEIASVVVADATGAEAVPVGALLDAEPDPFCAMESAWLQHLEAAHPDVIDRLAGRLPMSLRRGRVRPLGLDRYGLRLRVEGADADHDVRLPFPAPVDDLTGLSRAIRLLMGCPFRNGLRARRI